MDLNKNVAEKLMLKRCNYEQRLIEEVKVSFLPEKMKTELAELIAQRLQLLK